MSVYLIKLNEHLKCNFLVSVPPTFSGNIMKKTGSYSSERPSSYFLPKIPIVALSRAVAIPGATAVDCASLLGKFRARVTYSCSQSRHNKRGLANSLLESTRPDWCRLFKLALCQRICAHTESLFIGANKHYYEFYGVSFTINNRVFSGWSIVSRETTRDGWSVRNESLLARRCFTWRLSLSCLVCRFLSWVESHKGCNKTRIKTATRNAKKLTSVLACVVYPWTGLIVDFRWCFYFHTIFLIFYLQH